MRVLVCGGRDYTDKQFLWSVLDGFGPPAISEIISGMAVGADTFAVEWARARGIPLLEFPADWERHGRAAGPIRNQQMLDEGKPDLVIAFSGGRGTAGMMRLAHKAGVAVRDFS